MQARPHEQRRGPSNGELSSGAQLRLHGTRDNNQTNIENVEYRRCAHLQIEHMYAYILVKWFKSETEGTDIHTKKK